MGSRTYTVASSNLTLGAADGFIVGWINSVAAGATACGFELLRVELSQGNVATSFQFGVEIGLKATAFPTVTGVTPAPSSPGLAASQIVSGTGAAGTAGVNASANGAGTETKRWTGYPNSLNGMIWTPYGNSDRIIVMPGSGLGAYVKMLAGFPGTGNRDKWGVVMVYEEIG